MDSIQAHHDDGVLVLETTPRSLGDSLLHKYDEFLPGSSPGRVPLYGGLGLAAAVVVSLIPGLGPVYGVAIVLLGLVLLGGPLLDRLLAKRRRLTFSATHVGMEVHTGRGWRASLFEHAGLLDADLKPFRPACSEDEPAYLARLSFRVRHARFPPRLDPCFPLHHDHEITMLHFGAGVPQAELEAILPTVNAWVEAVHSRTG